jgi:hypothetical protein
MRSYALNSLRLSFMNFAIKHDIGKATELISATMLT